MTWPFVLGDWFTLGLVASGRSIARFGDGEFNLCLGRPCVTQRPLPELATALRRILRDPGDCLVGIPRQGAGPKALFWSRYDRPEIRDMLSLDDYASACITRPDSAPWIDNPDYWDLVRKLWLGKDVTLVRGSEKSLTADMLNGAASVREIVAPARDAFAGYDALLERVGRPSTAILCLGPTATVMAHDLCRRGVHAIDLGHVGMFLRKHEKGEPMIVTAADKAVDRHA